MPGSRLCHGCSALSSSLRSTDALSNSAVKFDLACSLLVPYMPLALVSLTLVAFATRVAGFKKEHQSTASSHHNHPRLNSWRWADAKRGQIPDLGPLRRLPRRFWISCRYGRRLARRSPGRLFESDGRVRRFARRALRRLERRFSSPLRRPRRGPFMLQSLAGQEFSLSSGSFFASCLLSLGRV